MKTVRLMLTIALLAVAGVATASNYDYNIHAQDDVVIGEDATPAPSIDGYADESYGVMPSWGTGCCERQPSKADHLWDNYCFEKHSGCCKSHCCGKTYCGTGPYSKGCCCKSKCGPKFHLPKLHILGRCRTKLSGCKQKLSNCCQKAKGCCQKAPCKSTKCCQKAPVCQKAPCCQKAPVCQKAACCKETKCCKVSTRCRKPLLSKLRLFRGCHSSKCGKGKGKGTVVNTTTNYGDGIPSPAVDGMIIEEEMPNDVPPAPAIQDPAA